MSRILLVDDDAELSGMLAEYLGQEGFDVEVCHDGESGLQRALSGDFALTVLDVMMPGMSGVEVLNRIRARSRMPVLMLTARGDDMDRVIGLELGADDYVPKPCTARELAARIRAILRRTASPEGGARDPAVIQFGDLTIQPESRTARWKNNALALTSTEYNLLEVLARNAGQTVSKKVLSEDGLGRPLARFDRSIDVHMGRIREKIGMMADGRSCIQTVFRQGYQLVRE
ncbi:MAG: response regulator transcription factor [Pseudomonadota bacterium]|nr:response regulator transcription factor [Pseudomonadota bacterium]